MIKRFLTTALGCATLLAPLSLLASEPASSPRSQRTQTAFKQLVDSYFDFHFEFEPTEATQAGLHQYDDRLEDFSRSAVDREVAGLQRFQKKFSAIQESELSQESAGDLEVLTSSIQADLLELQTVQRWKKDPDGYPSSLANSVFVIMNRNFAPPEERLRSVIARERKMPQALAEGRKNLSHPPKVFTEVALQQISGTIAFFQDDVPKAFVAVKDPALLAAFKASNDAVVQALIQYQKFLQDDLLPVSDGDFRLGAETFSKKLLYEEMVSTPLDRLLEIGYADLRRNQQQFKEVAARIDPNRTPAQVLADLRKDHPAPDTLLQSFRDILGGLRQYIEQKKIVTIPSPVPPLVVETPPFLRALSTASMDTPGAYETKAKEAMFNVTLPDPSWPPDKVEEWMQGFNRGTITSTAIHEVYPGHYTQFLWVQDAPSKTRKLVSNNSNAEGWAHYCEQMMLDEGYGGGDPKLRLGQLLDALLRDARFIAGIKMHTGKMTLDEAKAFFIDEGYQVPPVAEEEAKRGTSDPTYLYYTLGKLQILHLREDYRKRRGSEFTLLEFHDRLMRQGSVPMKIIRKSMLGDDSPVL
ncbi:MAG TPA: DUF885 domain-containing protein [Terriglobales bacterium]|jgi:uncharacterized protein (DUF885 family)|nr:DUF885 domain-containing protein [Terriglobales bacterium]